MKVAQNLKIIVTVLEVPKGTEEVQRQIEVVGTFERPHVSLNELEVQAPVCGTPLRRLQVPGSSIHADYAKTTTGKFKTMPAWPATEVKDHCSSRRLEELHNLIPFDRAYFISPNL